MAQQEVGPPAEGFSRWGQTWGSLDPGQGDAGDELGELFDYWWTVRKRLVCGVEIHESCGVLGVEYKDLVVRNIGDSRGSRNGR